MFAVRKGKSGERREAVQDGENGTVFGVVVLSEIKYAFVIMILFGSSLSTGKELFLRENDDFTFATVKWTYQEQASTPAVAQTRLAGGIWQSITSLKADHGTRLR